MVMSLSSMLCLGVRGPGRGGGTELKYTFGAFFFCLKMMSRTFNFSCDLEPFFFLFKIDAANLIFSCGGGGGG